MILHKFKLYCMQCEHMWDPIVILPEYVALYMYVISQ